MQATVCRPQVSQLDESVFEYLKNVSRETPGGFVTALELQFQLLPGAKDMTCRAVRAAIRRLNDRGLPIISTRHGFKLATTRREIEQYKHGLMGRAQRILDRIEALDFLPAIS